MTVDNWALKLNTRCSHSAQNSMGAVVALADDEAIAALVDHHRRERLALAQHRREPRDFAGVEVTACSA